MKEHSQIVHFVDPKEFYSYVIGWNYFDVLDANIKKQDLTKKYYQTFIEELILLIHGTSNSSQEKDERVYKKMKERYESASKIHIDKNIKRMTKIGYMFSKDFLAQMKISQ